MTPSASFLPFYLSVAVITDVDDRLLLVRKQHTEAFMLPGGKIEEDEAPEAALRRELWEELGMTFVQQAFAYAGLHEAAAANEPGYGIQAHVFYRQLAEAISLTPQAEIAEALWFDKSRMGQYPLAPLVRQLRVDSFD